MRIPVLPALAVVLGSALLAAQQPASEDLARRQYETGLTFMQGQRYSEGLKDFQAVIDSFPKTAVADNSLLQIALYQLDIARDITATQTAIDRLIKEYADSDSAPMARVIEGRVGMAKGRTPADVDAALASFERVERLFPGNEAVPAAGFYAGETLRLVRRNEEALDRFRSVSAGYPNSPWAAQANLAAGYCLVQADRALAALPEIQRVRQQLPGSSSASEATNLNTILYRLYVRAPGVSAFSFSGRYVGDEKSNFNDVIGVNIDRANRLLLGHKSGIAIFDPKGPLKSTVAANEPSAFFVDDQGRIVFARQAALIAEKAPPAAITVPQPAPKPPRPVEEMPSVVALSTGQRLVVDKKEKDIIRVAPDGTYIGPFLTQLNTERLAINRLDDVAIIDKDGKAIVLADRDGKVLTKIPWKGQNYQFDEPVDVAFDQLGHLYVLDRGKASVHVFGPKNRLITTFTIAEKSPGAFTRARAFTLDATGRLYIFDERSKRIQVYQ
jgi:TolA-binding protein